MGLPVGYHFEPEDHELVNYYLVSRIKNGVSFPPPHPRMPDVDVYRDHPYKTFWSLGASQSEDEESKCFFFTALEKVSKKGKTDGKEGSNINRKVGCFGTWKGENKIPVVMRDNGNATLIGYKRNFTFSKAKDCPELDDIQEGEWSMREYSLPEDQYDGNLVLCCITQKLAKAKNTDRDSRSSVVNVEDQENSKKVYNDQQQQRNKRVCVGGSSQCRYNNVQESGNCYNFEQELQPAVWNNNNVNHTQQLGVTELKWNNSAQQGSQPEYYYQPVCNSSNQFNMLNAHNYRNSESNVNVHADELRYLNLEQQDSRHLNWRNSDDMTSYMLNDILTYSQQQQMAMNMLYKPQGAMTPHP